MCHRPTAGILPTTNNCSTAEQKKYPVGCIDGWKIWQDVDLHEKLKERKIEKKRKKSQLQLNI